MRRILTLLLCCCAAFTSCKKRKQPTFYDRLTGKVWVLDSVFYPLGYDSTATVCNKGAQWLFSKIDSGKNQKKGYREYRQYCTGEPFWQRSFLHSYKKQLGYYDYVFIQDSGTTGGITFNAVMTDTTLMLKNLVGATAGSSWPLSYKFKAKK